MVDGDASDYRYGDPRGRGVALYRKGQARTLAPGETGYAQLKLSGLEEAPVQLAVFCDEATDTIVNLRATKRT